MAHNAFLIYANRSGSTLLAAQLSQRIAPEQLLVVPEFRLVEYLFHVGDEKARRLGPDAIKSMIDDDRQISANLGLSHERLLSILQGTIGEGILVKLERVLEAYVAANSQRAEPEVVLWKWGNAATYVDEIARLLPRARFVHIVRDGRGVVNSLLTSESPYFPGEDLARGSTLHGVDHWKSSLRRSARPARVGLDVLDVRYSDLVRMPDEVCRVVSDFLDLRDEPPGSGDDHRFRVSRTEEGIHRLAQDRPKIERIEGWRTELAEWRRYVIEHAAGRELKDWGYDLKRTDVTSVTRVAWLARAQIERITGFVKWSLRRLRPYGARLTVRLLRLRAKAWLAARRPRPPHSQRE
jgi:Sulfotransferase family